MHDVTRQENAFSAQVHPVEWLIREAHTPGLMFLLDMGFEAEAIGAT